MQRRKKTTKFVLELVAFRVRLPFKRRFALFLCGVLASSSCEIELNWKCWKSIDNWGWSTYAGPLYRRKRFICLNLSIPVWNSVTIVVVQWTSIYSWNNSWNNSKASANNKKYITKCPEGTALEVFSWLNTVSFPLIRFVIGLKNLAPICFSQTWVFTLVFPRLLSVACNRWAILLLQQWYWIGLSYNFGFFVLTPVLKRKIHRVSFY